MAQGQPTEANDLPMIADGIDWAAASAQLRAAESGDAADDLIDALLGHQRFGREPLGLHATTRYRSALELLEDLLASALEECGIGPLPYCA